MAAPTRAIGSACPCCSRLCAAGPQAPLRRHGWDSDDGYGVRLALDWLAVHLDPAHVGVSSEAMSAARSEIDKTDLVNFTEIRLFEQSAFGLDLFDIQLHPPDIG